MNSLVSMINAFLAARCATSTSTVLVVKMSSAAVSFLLFSLKYLHVGPVDIGVRGCWDCTVVEWNAQNSQSTICFTSIVTIQHVVHDANTYASFYCFFFYNVLFDFKRFSSCDRVA